MKKSRIIPLFIIDKNRTHKLGECDFIVCTDQESGFIAKLDYIDKCEEDSVSDTECIHANNGIGARLRIIRNIGSNPNIKNIHSLLVKGMKIYLDNVQKKINVKNPDKQDCIDFIDILIRGNKSNLDSCGSNMAERQIVLMSLNMMNAIRERLSKPHHLDIERVLEERNISMADLARKMDVERSTISRYVNGNITLSTMQKVAEALNCDIIDLFS